jgi:hypothetical protein
VSLLEKSSSAYRSALLDFSSSGTQLNASSFLFGTPLSQFFERRLHVGGQGSFDFEDSTIVGMAEFQPPGVERLAFQQNEFVGEIAADFAARDSASIAVLLIAEDGAAKMMQMHADLMRAAGFRNEPNRRETVEAFDDLEESLRGATFGIVVADRHFFALMGMESDRAVDDVPIARRIARD